MNTKRSLNFNHYLYMILYWLDIFTTVAVMQYYTVKYREYIFPQKLVNALGSSFPMFAYYFVIFVDICYIVILTKTIFYFLKKKNFKACAILLWVLISKDVFFIVLRLIEKYNL